MAPRLSVSFQSPRGGPALGVADLPMRVLSLSKRANGGPYQAQLSTRAKTRADLESLAGLVGCRALIEVEGGLPAWWGVVRTVELTIGGLTKRVSLDQLANRVAVAYTAIGAGDEATGDPGMTGWVEDPQSIARWGVKELLGTISGTTAEHAALLRDRKLAAARFFPSPAIQEVTDLGGAAPVYEARIICAGYWWTLGWRYANIPAGLALAFETLGGEIGVGDGDTARLAQSFECGPGDLAIRSVELPLRAVGAPTGGVTAGIYTVDGEGLPDTLAGEGIIEEGAIGSGLGWAAAAFDPPVALAANTAYLLVISASGDEANYYTWGRDPSGGYPAGRLIRQLPGAGTWTPTDGDAGFRLFGTAIMPTSQQVLNLIRAYGQFFARVVVTADSGIATETYRDGTASALVEVEAMLEAGTIGGRRMLAAVDRWRQVTVDLEPEPYAPYRLTTAGQVLDPSGAPLPKALAPAGVWARVVDEVEVASDAAEIGDGALMFVEQIEYDAESDTLSLTARGEADIWDTGGVADG